MVLSVLILLPLTTAVSIGVEFLQVFAGDRVPSNTDVAAQVAGCLVGIGAWAIFGDGTTEWLRETFRVRPEDRPARLLTGFAVAWVFVNLAPFDITVDAGELAERFRSGRISVFPFSFSELLRPRRAWDTLAEILAGIPLGLFGLAGWKTEHLRRPAFAFAVGLSFVVLVELAQVFIASHSASVSDVVFAAFGIALGVSLGRRVTSRRSLPDDPATSLLINGYAFALVALWIVVLCAYHWGPYDFSVDTQVIRQKLARISFLPLAGYLGGSYLNALNDLLTKLALSVPLGLGAAFILTPAVGSRGVVVAGSLIGAAAIFGGIEAGQLFLPSRTPDPTDVLTGVSGVYLGIRLAHLLRNARVDRAS